jgi:phosphatidylglycerophosphate synthase
VTAHESTHGTIATPAPPPAAPPGAAEAVLLATAAFADGPAAALRLQGETLLDRLRRQLSTLGVGHVHVVTRPAVALEAGAVRHESADPAEDLRVVAGIARAGAGPLVIAPADLVAHREALAGLLADPRLDTAILAAPPQGGPFAPGIRVARARVVSAGSAYHRVERADARFAGVLKVAPADRALLAATAERLAALVAAPPTGWRRTWEDGGGAGEWPEADRERRRAAAAGDVTALLLVGLVRADVRVKPSALRGLTCVRALSAADVARAATELAAVDEERVRLDAAVKANDGFFTTFLVDPYSKHLARWAARRGLTPNQVTAASALLGLAAAAAFAFGTRAGLVAGAVLLQLSFTTDCVDGQLARYARQFSKLGGWLDAVLDRAKEYVVYAGLALGATHAWVLAGAALTLQTFRHTLEFSYSAVRQPALGSVPQPPLEQSGDEPPAARRPARPSPPAVTRVPGTLWVRKLIVFPIGERFAAISLAAALGSGRLAMEVLLVWSAVAAVYTVCGRALRSFA